MIFTVAGAPARGTRYIGAVRETTERVNERTNDFIAIARPEGITATRARARARARSLARGAVARIYSKGCVISAVKTLRLELAASFTAEWRP